MRTAALFTLAVGLVVGTASPSKALENDGSKAITTKMSFNDVLGQPLSNGCHYVATIKGDVTPLGDSGSKAKSGTVEANVNVDTSLACPHKAVVRAAETVRELGPITRGQLEKSLESVAAIVSDASGKRCLYRPDFSFVNGKLASGRVTLQCPPPTAE